MKSIERFVTEKYLGQRELPVHKQIPAENYIDWANIGAREAQRWVGLDEELPPDAEQALKERKRKIQDKLDVFRKNIEDIRQYTNKDSTISILAHAFESVMTDEQKTTIREENERKIANLPMMEKQYEYLMSEFDKGNYNMLLDLMGIEKIPNPISFKFDNEDDMRALKNAFGAEAIEEAEGDVNKMYARLKVEQKYNV